MGKVSIRTKMMSNLGPGMDGRVLEWDHTITYREILITTINV